MANAQPLLNAANPGDVVRLDALTYEPFVVPDGVSVIGSGTLVRVPDNRAVHGIQIAAGALPRLVEGITVVGNWMRGGSGCHGVRIGDQTANVTFRRITVTDAAAYGFGVQTSTGERWENLIFEECVVDGCGSDGWDFKNDTQDCGPAHLIGCTARRYALTDTSDVGFDIRGHCHLLDCVVDGLRGGGGFRFRARPLAGGNGGSSGSSINRWLVKRAGGTRTDRAVFVEPSSSTTEKSSVGIGRGSVV